MTGSLRALGLQGAARLARNWEEFAHAAEFEQECLANWKPGDDALQIGMARWLQGQISVGQGAYDSAVIYLRQASELFETCGCTWQLESIGSDLGAAALGRGDYTGALELFEEAHALCRARNDLRDITYSLNYIGLTACAVGDGNTARTRSDEAIPLWKRLQSPELIAEGMAVVATIVARFGSPEWSARLFGAADALRERIGHAFTLPEREFFELAQQSVQERLGEQAYTAAFDAGRQLTLDQAIAEAASGQPAPVTPVQAMADPYGLTPREREVFGLLAGRLTDPEIAEALFISPQTASTHVKRVLGKLGVSNRREAAALAARELQA